VKYEEDALGWRFSRESLRTLDPAPLIATWQSLVEADYRDVLGRIDVPVLLVYGGASNFYDVGTARYVHEHIPGAELLVYEGADHSPHIGEHERFERDLAAFIADPRGTPAAQ
jgi:pimeloyl-ACP methyl ester carboxylesterase